MKKAIKILLTVFTAAILISVFTVVSFAVPAYNNHGDNRTCKSHANKLVTLDDIPSGNMTSSGAKRLQKVNAKKNIPLVIIVIGFNNVSYNNNYNWGDSIFEAENSLMQYYSDMSFGQFTFVPVTETSQYGSGSNTNKYDKANDGIIHVKLNSRHDNWSLEPSLLFWNQNVNMTKAFINAIKAADSYIDFSQYDSNLNGLIENNEMALAFVLAGNEAAYQTEYDDASFWSHAFSISEAINAYTLNLNVPVVDGVKVDSYIGIAENLEENKQEPICVLAHELGHYLGLPDLYDTYYSKSNEWSPYDVAHLSVMCSGVWCEDKANNTYIPSSMDAWSRYELGWIQPTRVTASGNFTLTSQNYDNQSEKISTVLIPTQNSNEYYIAENRQFTGWDRFLGDYFSNDNGGVVIWHIDKNIYNKNYDLNSVNNSDHRPSVMPLYPEKVDSKYTYTGKGGVVYSPFYDSNIWSNKFSADVGDVLDLPLYAKGKNANKRIYRTLSGIKVSFLDDSSDTMNINVNTDSHVHSIIPLGKNPTCLANGLKDSYCCTYCHKYFLDSSCQNQTTFSELSIPATGHSFVFEETVKPLYDEDGYDLYVCEHCGQEKHENLKKLVGWGYDSEGNKYYVKSDGTALKGWQKISGKWYFFAKNAQMKTGWVKSDGKWYYMSAKGVMQTGWKKLDGKWYYLSASGAMQTGWKKLDGKWYYLNASGVMQTGWKKLDGKWYYFNSSGVMQTENLTYKGKVYKFKSSGVCINP